MKAQLAAVVGATVIVAQLGSMYGWMHTGLSLSVVALIVVFLRIAAYGPEIFRANHCFTKVGVRRIAEMILVGAAALGNPVGGRDSALEASAILDFEEQKRASRGRLLISAIGLALCIPLSSRLRARSLERNPTPTLDSLPVRDKWFSLGDVSWLEAVGPRLAQLDDSRDLIALKSLLQVVADNALGDDIAHWLLSLPGSKVRSLNVMFWAHGKCSGPSTGPGAWFRNAMLGSRINATANSGAYFEL